MQRLLYTTALASILAGSASAMTICGINTDTVLKWSGYAGKQNVWFDKGDYFFKFSSIYKGKTHTINHFQVNKESCQKNTILITNDTHDKNHISTPFEPNIDLNIDASMDFEPTPDTFDSTSSIFDVSNNYDIDRINPNIDASGNQFFGHNFLISSFEDEDDEFIGTEYT